MYREVHHTVEITITIITVRVYGTYVRVISYVTNIWAVNNRELNVWKSMAMGKRRINEF